MKLWVSVKPAQADLDPVRRPHRIAALYSYWPALITSKNVPIQKVSPMPVHIINPLLYQALQFAKSGYPILPLYEPAARGCSCGAATCSRIGKHPRTSHGFKDATTAPQVIARWWERWPDANLGIATGSASGRFVLDVDGPIGRATLLKLGGPDQPAPDAAKILTGRGEHYYFKTEGRKVGNLRLGPGLDLRGDGGYVVAVGSKHANDNRYRHSQWGQLRPRLIPGTAPDWLKNLISKEDPAPALLIRDQHKGLDNYADAALNGELDRLRQAAKGARNSSLNMCAFRLGQLVAAGVLEESMVARQVTAVAQAIGLGEGEATATIRSGLKAGKESPRDLELVASRSEVGIAVDPLAEAFSQLGETDADNAQRLARRFEKELVCTPGKDYLVYDGQRWVRDDGRKRFRFAEETARAIAYEAGHISEPRDKAHRATFATRSLSKGALDRMLDIAKHRVMKLDRSFDSDQLILNVANGTIDLRTGKLRPHDHSDLITKVVPVTYNPDATCPTFTQFLSQALKGDVDLISYVQKAVGYSLTGMMGEQVFFFPFGPSNSGKSTFVNLMRDMLGDYGLHTPTETLMAKQHEGNTADLARLQGARMVTAVEVNWNRQIDEARVKALTGGDPITARHLYQGFFQFQPVCKIWLVANDLPGVRGTAEAFWRRVHLIPFDVVIPVAERDQTLVQRLKSEAEGILAWAVRGSLAWQREGLSAPDAIRQGLKHWQNKADHVTRFCNEELIRDHGNFLTSHDLNQHYRSWCERHGEHPLDARKLKAALEGQDLTYKRTNRGSVWSGLKLRSHS